MNAPLLLPCSRGVLPTPVTNQRGGSQATALVRGNEAMLASASRKGFGDAGIATARDWNGHVNRNTAETIITGISTSRTTAAGADSPAPAFTRESINCNSFRRALLVGRLPRGDVHKASMGQVAPLTFISASNGGETAMPRVTPHTAATITAISDGYRAARVVFLKDGMVDADEMVVLRAFRDAQATALRADWSRRARQSIENEGEMNPRLVREFREIETEYPLDAS